MKKHKSFLLVLFLIILFLVIIPVVSYLFSNSKLSLNALLSKNVDFHFQVIKSSNISNYPFYQKVNNVIANYGAALSEAQSINLEFFGLSTAISTIMSVLVAIAVEFTKSNHWGCSFHVKRSIFSIVFKVILMGSIVGFISLCIIFSDNLSRCFLPICLSWNLFLVLASWRIVTVYCSPKAAAFIIYYRSVCRGIKQPQRPKYIESLESPHLFKCELNLLRASSIPMIYLLSSYLKEQLCKFRFKIFKKAPPIATQRKEKVSKEIISLILKDHLDNISYLDDIRLKLLCSIVSGLSYYYADVNYAHQSSLTIDSNTQSDIREEMLSLGTAIARCLINPLTQTNPTYNPNIQELLTHIGKIEWYYPEKCSKTSIYCNHHYFYIGLCLELVKAYESIPRNKTHEIQDMLMKIVVLCNNSGEGELISHRAPAADYKRYLDYDWVPSATLKLLFAILSLVTEYNRELENLHRLSIALAVSNNFEKASIRRFKAVPRQNPEVFPGIDYNIILDFYMIKGNRSVVQEYESYIISNLLLDIIRSNNPRTIKIRRYLTIS